MRGRVAFRSLILAVLARHGESTPAELRHRLGVSRDEINAHSWGLVDLQANGLIRKVADGLRATRYETQESPVQRAARLAASVPVPASLRSFDPEGSSVRGIAVFNGDNAVPAELIRELVSEQITRFDRSVLILRDDIDYAGFCLRVGEGLAAVHTLDAKQVDLVRAAAERKHDYYDPDEATVARNRYDALYKGDTRIILDWFSRGAHKAWVTRGEYALLKREKRFTHFFELRYEFMGKNFQDGRLCVSEAQAKRALYRARSRVTKSLIGADILKAQVAPFVKPRVRVAAHRSG